MELSCGADHPEMCKGMLHRENKQEVSCVEALQAGP